MAANLRNLSDFAYICSQKNNMNGIYILLTILLYFGILLLVARLTGRHSDNDAFFRGNRRSPWYIVSFGMIGASLSGVTFVSVPGMVRGIDMTYMQTCFGFFIGYLIIAHVLLPLYYKLNLTSIYTYLGDRIGKHAYKTGASFFLLSKIIGAAARLYLVCLILQHYVFDAFHIPFAATVIGIVLLIWLYTRRSGIRTIVWTDSLQTLCLLLALGLILYEVSGQLNLDFPGLVHAIRENEHSRIFVFDDWHSKQNFFKQFFSGIFITIVMTGLDQDMMQKNFEGFATNSGFLAAQKTGEAYKGFRKGRWWDLEAIDIERLRSQVKDVEVITPSVARWGSNAIYGDKKYDCSVKGLYPDYLHIESQEMAYGRFINDVDIREARKVCVIGKRVYESLFKPGEDPCGKYVRVDGIYYQVIGMSSSEGDMNIQGRASEAVTLPFTTMQQTYNLGGQIDVICFTVKRGVKVSDVQPQMEEIIKAAHYIAPNDKQALMYLNAEAMFSMVDNLFTGIHILIWMVGLGTLLAGAIGVSNIMMVTVKERTTEIGIRRAIGARPKDILQQILSESMVLTTIAGMFGISFAVMVLQLVEMGANSNGGDAHFQVSFGLAVGTCALLIALGMLAGLAPAYRAMAIKPIEAIRDE